METNNEVIKALGQIPELIETNKTVIIESEKKYNLLATTLQKPRQLAIPEAEVNKIMSATVSAVRNTKCAAPDVSEMSRYAAKDIVEKIHTDIRSEITSAVKAAIADVPVKVEHHHTHTTLRYMCEMAEETLRNWILALAIYAGILTLVGIVSACSYFNGDKYLGAQYVDIYLSKYTTDAERKMLDDNVYTVGFMPIEFNKTPKLVKQKIKRNRQILEQRKAEANANKGKFSTKVPLVR